jgi:hypothetical protein
MLRRSMTEALALVALLLATSAQADDAKYPNWKGQWWTINPRFGGQALKYDPTKAFGAAQQAPLTPEYQKIHEARACLQLGREVGISLRGGIPESVFL